MFCVPKQWLLIEFQFKNNSKNKHAIALCMNIYENFHKQLAWNVGSFDQFNFMHLYIYERHYPDKFLWHVRIASTHRHAHTLSAVYTQPESISVMWSLKYFSCSFQYRINFCVKNTSRFSDAGNQLLSYEIITNYRHSVPVLCAKINIPTRLPLAKISIFRIVFALMAAST